MNTKDMLLESSSGFSMPFEAKSKDDIQLMLGYGEQVHPNTGQSFYHRGIDLVCHSKPLFALATGTVVGMGTDAVHGNYIITKYGHYEVKYGHIAEGYASYGTPVVAAQPIAKSGEFLHFEVTFDGQVLAPGEFLSMVEGNKEMLESMGIHTGFRFENMGVDVHTRYDGDQEELLPMLLRWLPEFFQELLTQSYVPSQSNGDSLINLFARNARSNYFFEKIPSYMNPLGLGSRSSALAGKAQEIILSEFLNYMAVRHQTFLSSWGDEQKKKLLSRLSVTE